MPDMEAIHLPDFVGAPQDLRVSRVPVPRITPSCPILVKVSHAALNYVDILYAQGKHQNNKTLVKPPFTLGLEFAGIVKEVHPQAANIPFKVGDVVYGAGNGGAFAEFIAIDQGSLRKVPPSWTEREAAGVASSFPVSLGALRRAQLRAGETVLIHAAAGGLGIAACQIALAYGATVIATVGSDDKAKVLKDLLRIKHVINYSVPGWEDRVLDLTGGRSRGGADVVFDPVGLVKESIRAAKYRGRIVVVGFAGREGNLEQLAVNRILLKSVQVIGYRYGEDNRRIPGEQQIIWEELEKLVESDKIRPIAYHERFVGLQSVPKAMHAMLARKVYGKAAIQVATPTAGSSKI